MKINEGILFEGEEEKVYVFFVLGAVNNDSHIETLMELMELIEDEDRIEEIIEAKNCSGNNGFNLNFKDKYKYIKEW